MTAFIIRRLLYMFPIVLGVLLVTFTLFTLIGGDISQQIAGKNADAETIAEIRHEYGLDKPLFVGLKSLEGDDWEAAKDATIQQLQAVEDKKAVEKSTEKQKVEPVKITAEQAKKQWLWTTFKGRLAGGHLIQAAQMLDFDSQFYAHFAKALTFDFGRAMDRERISAKILRGIGPSLMLTTPMFIGEIIAAVSLALIIAYVRGTIWDITAVVLCVAGMSIPYLSFIIFGQYFFAYKLDWFPIIYLPEEPMIKSVGLPILIGIVASLGGELRFYRTIMLDEMRNDYVRTAFAKGLSTTRVLFKHVLKNAMIPIITNVVLTIPHLILGSFLLERFFGIPGLGYLMIEAIGARDFFVINAMTFIFSLLIVIFTLLADICYALVDPRISLK
ncbi:ABC transporter permease [Anaerohalosphaeraceae bacterium U12dextr]